jgi:sugar phosphate isomerase/epimerase
MSDPSVALQMYTLRALTKTPSDLASSLKRAKKMGYNAVQLSKHGPVDPNELAKMLEGEGLTCCATHVSMDRLKQDLQAVIDDHKLWDCQYTAIGSFGWGEPSLQTWNDFIRDFSELGARMAKQGLSLGYHNHAHELVKMDGKVILDRLADGLDKSVWMEIDTYWVQFGGGDPVKWIKRFAGRIPCVHVKDMGMTVGEKAQNMIEVGEGNLNWPDIIDAARQSGVKWRIVEQDNCNGKDPFDCSERSLRNLEAMGLKSTR